MTQSFVIVLREEIVLFFEQFFITTLIRLGKEPVEPGLQGVHPQSQYVSDTYSNKGGQMEFSHSIYVRTPNLSDPPSGLACTSYQ